MKEEELSLCCPFTVTSADTDMYGRIRLGALVNLLIQSAIRSADVLGFGFGNLREEKLYWVLSRMTLQIKRPLTWYEKLEVETWPKNVEKIIYLRDFLIRDKNGDIVVRGTSGWLAVDSESKRPKLYTGKDAMNFTRLKDKHALDTSPLKILPVTEGEPYRLSSTYFDIDLNKHVTSSRYIDWAMDGFPNDFHSNHYPRSLSVNYLKETFPGDSIEILRKEEVGMHFRFEGTHTGKNTTAFRAEIGF